VRYGMDLDGKRRKRVERYARRVEIRRREKIKVEKN
jgi:hypothetical protein